MSLPFHDLQAFSAVSPARVEHELAGYLQSGKTKTSIKKSLISNNSVRRLKALIEHVSKRIHGRDDAIRAVVAGLAAGAPTVLLGPPGTAKSLIAREIGVAAGLHSAAGASGSSGTSAGANGGSPQDEFYFEYLLTAHTMPEELFGPIDLLSLQEGRIHRKVDRMLPQANLVFLDEVFRGSSQILNTLLTILNEHRFHDGIRVLRVPLVGVVAASNDPPRDPDMQAFYDRFPVRVWIDSILDEPEAGAPGASKERVAKLLATALDNDARQFVRAASDEGHDRDDRQLSCLNDFRCVRALILKELRSTSLGDQDSLFRDAVLEVRDIYSRQFGKRLSDRALLAVRKMVAAFELLGMKRKDAVMEGLLLTAPDPEAKEAVLDYIHGQFHSGAD